MDAQAILIDSYDAAKLLSMTSRGVVRLARAGRLPSVDAGDGELRFSPDALREWARKSCRTEGATDAK